MSFTGNEDQSVTINDGSAITEAFRAWLASSGSTDPTMAVYISRRSMEAILANSQVVGMRCHFGIDSTGRALVFNGVDSNENDLLDSGDFIGDRSYKSPPHTGNANSLNS